MPNDCRIWLKLECDNPWGSHYDRVYLALFRYWESQGRIQPGDKVLETTSGSAGVSFAGIGRELGYHCIVAIPAGGERAREEAIKAQGAELIFTSAETYVSGFPDFLRRYLPDNPDVFFLNHSMWAGGTENTITTSALAAIGEEVLEQRGREVDVYVAGLGNGSSVLGPGRVFNRAGVRVVTFESFQSGVGYEMIYPGRYKQEYGIEPGSLPRHRLPGTSFPGIPFPHIRAAFEEELVSDTVLVSDELTNKQYAPVGRDLEGFPGLPMTHGLPHWDNYLTLPYGRTTMAGLAVAWRIASKNRGWRDHHISGIDIVIIAYDKPDRYDS